MAAFEKTFRCRRPFWPLAFLFAVAIVLATAPEPAEAASCFGVKLKAISKLVPESLDCAVKYRDALDSPAYETCVLKAFAKYDKSFAKAGACTGSRDDCLLAASTCVLEVMPLGAPPPSGCEATRAKAAVKLGMALLLCHTKKSATVVPACQLKAAAKFKKAYDKVTGCSGDGLADTVAQRMTAACVPPVVTTDASGAVIDLCVPTTTTTTTTTSTTTTTMPSCGEPSISSTCFHCSVSSACLLSCVCADHETIPLTCSEIGTEWPGCRSSELQLPCADHIENCDGHLTCTTPPAGSYVATCKNCSVTCGAGLTCECATQDASLETCAFFPERCPASSVALPCAGTIENCNGQLTCTDGACPATP